MTELAAMPDAELAEWLQRQAKYHRNAGMTMAADRFDEAARRLAAPKGDGVVYSEAVAPGNLEFVPSAPQAASSADERSDALDKAADYLEAICQSHARAFPSPEYGQKSLATMTKWAQEIRRAAGYRKRAAPDVAVEVVDVQREKWELVSAIYDFIWEWDYAGGPDRLNLPALGNAIRSKFASPFESKHDRLAALPKGQEDE
jgi:hypothetical protein